MEMGDRRRPSAALPRERAPGTQWIGGWVGLRAGLDALEKRKMSYPCQESNLNSSGCPALSPVATPTEMSPVSKQLSEILVRLIL
jgi:hypothetical protein